MYNFLKELSAELLAPKKESQKLSMRDVHARDIFSLVISGNEFGKLKRVFIADRKLKPFDVQYHTHRYGVRITILKGTITHHRAVIVQQSDSDIVLSNFKYKSVLNGGAGLSYDKEVGITTKDNILPVGCQITLSHKDYHTMSCSKGSIWVVEELGFEKEYSNVLGVPFVTNGLYNPPAMFQIVDKSQLVLRAVNELLLQYNLVSPNPKLEKENVFNVICDIMGQNPAKAKSKSRKRILVECRQLFCFIMARNSNNSLVEIGNYIGGRDHSTVIHGRDSITDLLETDVRINDCYNLILEKLGL